MVFIIISVVPYKKKKTINGINAVIVLDIEENILYMRGISSKVKALKAI